MFLSLFESAPVISFSHLHTPPPPPPPPLNCFATTNPCIPSGAGESSTYSSYTLHYSLARYCVSVHLRNLHLSLYLFYLRKNITTNPNVICLSYTFPICLCQLHIFIPARASSINLFRFSVVLAKNYILSVDPSI